MNKKKYSLFVASMMLLAGTSCTQDEVIKSSSSDQMTTFKVSLEGEANSRTAGDGKTVDRLYYEVYQGGKKVLDNKGEDANADPVTKNEDGGFIVEMPIMRGEKYDIMFWAEAENSVYDATDLQVIKVNYDVVAANKEAYDAFFYGEENFIATSNETTIVLTRPFGQLNVGTTVADWKKAKTMIANGDPVTQSEVKVKGLANRFNVLTHAASVEGEVGEVTFTKAALNGETFDVKVSDTEKAEYQNLAMNYLLVPTSQDKHQGNVDITTTFWRIDTEKLFDIVLPNVPVQRNWRTNILGDLLAADKTFEIVIDPIFADDYNYPKTMEEQLRMAAAIGGEVTLTEDVVLSQALVVQYDMIINLNGKKITAPGTVYVPNEVSALICVKNGATLTIKGDGTIDGSVSDDYAVEVRGGDLVIEGGEYIGAATAAYAVTGRITIKGGKFSQVGYENDDFVLNLKSNGDLGAGIEVFGGSFMNFDPSDNAAENPHASFVAEGYEVVKTKDGADTWYQVVTDVTDIVLNNDYAEVYTAKGLLKWSYIVNKENEKYGLILMQDIVMPAFTIEEDAANGTYVFTDNAITVTEGVPSGSNWIPLRNHTDCNGKYFCGKLDGKGNSISGLLINYDKYTAGLIGYSIGGGKVMNLTLKDAVVYSSSQYVGAVVGFAQNGSLIENVHLVNTTVKGAGNVGGIVGYNYRKKGKGFNEELSYVSNCTTDVNTKVESTGSVVGGICGNNYGSVIVNCVNNADVNGKSTVGGIAGQNRDYYANKTDGSIVADGYVMACVSTEEAKITASNGYAGGIVGLDFTDVGSHKFTEAYVVACHSASEVKGETTGAIIGGISGKSTIVASWAQTKIVSNESAATLAESAKYDKAEDVTKDIVDAMNAAIVNFNATNAEQVKCEYKWEWVSGSWPKLVSSVNN